MAEVPVGGNLLITPQQLRSSSQPSGPASWYLRIHPHGSSRVCWSVRKAMDDNAAVASCASISMPPGA